MFPEDDIWKNYIKPWKLSRYFFSFFFLSVFKRWNLLSGKGTPIMSLSLEDWCLSNLSYREKKSFLKRCVFDDASLPKNPPLRHRDRFQNIFSVHSAKAFVFSVHQLHIKDRDPFSNTFICDSVFKCILPFRWKQYAYLIVLV